MTTTEQPITRELVRVLLVSDPNANGAMGPGLRVTLEGPSPDDDGLLRALCWGLLEFTGTDAAGLAHAQALVQDMAEALIAVKGVAPARALHLRIVPDLPPDGETGGTPGA
jgi:hypothetical protein